MFPAKSTSRENSPITKVPKDVYWVFTPGIRDKLLEQALWA